MTEPLRKPKQRSSQPSKQNQKSYSNDKSKQNDTSDKMEDQIVNKINQLKSLKEYQIRELVEDTEQLGKRLVAQQLKTNQIRKFLDAVNRFKVQNGRDQETFKQHRDELHILRYHLAYAAKKNSQKSTSPVEPLKKVLEAAIKKSDQDLEDFKRLVQLIESIVAYHKAEGGQDQ